MDKDFREACVVLLVAFTCYKMSRSEDAGLVVTKALNSMADAVPADMKSEVIERVAALLSSAGIAQ